MMVEIQARYPDLYAVIKFVPKKNGLNPSLAELLNGREPDSMRMDDMKPREVRSIYGQAQPTACLRPARLPSRLLAACLRRTVLCTPC